MIEIRASLLVDFFSHLPTHFKFQGLGLTSVQLPKEFYMKNKYKNANFALQSIPRFVNECY